MSGFTEILLIVAVILAVIMLPRMLKRPEVSETSRSYQGLKLTGWERLAVLASFLWPALIALYAKPWTNAWYPFVYLAFGPVVLAWGIFWILKGFRR